MDVRVPGDDNHAMQHRRIATTAAMLADPSRAAMVLALMDGRSRSAKKLALDAGVTPQTASAHLKKLVAANILLWQGSGREKYFRIAGSEVAQAVEALSELGGGPLTPAAREIRFARCCYDHLAGQLGVCVTERLMQPGNAVLAQPRHRPGRTGKLAPAALPLLHRLDRAPAAHRRCAWRRAAAPL